MSHPVVVETKPKICTCDDDDAADGITEFPPVPDDINAAAAAPAEGFAGGHSPPATEEDGGLSKVKETATMMVIVVMDGGLGQHHSPGSSPEPKDLHPEGEEKGPKEEEEEEEEEEKEEEEVEEEEGGGGQGAEDCDCSDMTEKSEKEEEEETPRKTLSRDSSQDYTDSTGIDLHNFLVNMLTNNPRDRRTLLNLEQDLLDFISNNNQRKTFPPMTSYQRMLLHRVAAYFGMDHNVDPSGKSVVVNKTGSTRIPDQKFCDHIQDELPVEAGSPKVLVLKRDHRSFDHHDNSGEHLIYNSRSQDEETGRSSQQRRQIFSRERLGGGWLNRSKSEAARPSYQSPWSSTDGSDSSHQSPLPPPPPPAAPPAWAGGGATKPSSLSGCVVGPGMVHGDYTASSKSSGRLSETGCQPPGHGVSHPCSLPHPRVALPPTFIKVSRRRHVARGSRSRPAVITALAGFYVLPLGASAGMLPSGCLIDAHTGQSILGPDGRATQATVACAGRGLQQRRFSAVQPNNVISQVDALSAHYGNMSVTVRQPPEGCDVLNIILPPPDVHTSSPPLPYHLLQQPQNAVYSSPLFLQPYPTTPGAGFPSVMSPSALPQKAYVQPTQQVNSCCAASAHFSQLQPYQVSPNTSLPTYIPPIQSLPQPQAPIYQPALATGPQPAGGMGSQMQGGTGPYTPTPTYQPIPQQPYPAQQQQQLPVMLPCQVTSGGVAMQPYLGPLPPGQQTTSMSSMVNIMPVQVDPGQYQSSPSLPQVYAGIYSVASPAGVTVMQVPAHLQEYLEPPVPPPWALSPYPRKAPCCKLFGPEQQFTQRMAESGVRSGGRSSPQAVGGHPVAYQHLAPVYSQNNQNPPQSTFYPVGRGEFVPVAGTPRNPKPAKRPQPLRPAPAVPDYQKGRHPQAFSPPDSPCLPTSPQGPVGTRLKAPADRFSTMPISAEI